MNTRRAMPLHLERQYHHVLESELDRGRPLRRAKQIAAGVVNKLRARRAAQGRGPMLIGQGGSRRGQWYPGKRRLRPEAWICLQHDLRFQTKAGLLSHYRSHRRKA